jgi:hypothetical protein
VSASGNRMPDQMFRAIPAWGEKPKYNLYMAKAVPYLNEPYPLAPGLHPIDPYVSCDSNAFSQRDACARRTHKVLFISVQHGHNAGAGATYSTVGFYE